MCSRSSFSLAKPVNRLFTGPQGDQQTGDDRQLGLETGDDRQLGLDFDPVFTVTDQMPTAQDMFEESEEDFDGPTMFIDQGDDITWHVQDVGGDENRFALAGSATAVGFAVRLAFDLDDAHGPIEPGFDRGRSGEADDGVANNARPASILGQRAFLDGLKGRVDMDATHQRGTNVDNVPKQPEFHLAAIEHVDAVGLQAGREHLALVPVAAGQVHADGDPFEQLEVCMEFESPKAAFGRNQIAD